MTFHKSLFWFLISILFFAFENVKAQDQSKIDSLLQILETDISDRDRVDTYNALSESYKGLDNSKIEKYANPSILLAKSIDYFEGLADAYYLKGAVYIWSGDYDKTLALLDSTIKYADKANYLKGLGSAYNGIAFISRQKAEYKNAIEYYRKALEVRTTMNDIKAMAITYNNISDVYTQLSDTKMAIEYAMKSLAICEENGYETQMGRITQNLGNIYSNIGNYSKALELFERALEINMNSGNLEFVGNCYHSIAQVYQYKGDYPKALASLQKALKTFEEASIKNGIAICFDQIALVHYYMGNLNQAVHHYQKAIKIYQQLGDKYGESTVYNNFGYINSEQGNYKEAFENYSKGLLIAKEIDSKELFGVLYHSYGETYLASKNYKKSIEYFEKALKVQTKIGSKNDISEILISIGKIYMTINKYSEAISSINQGIEIANEIGVKVRVRDGAKLLSKIYSDAGNYKEAFNAQVLFKQMSDSLVNAQSTRQFTLLEANYAFNQEKDSIAFEQEKERLAFNAEIEKGETTQRATLVGLGLAILMIAVLFMFFNQKKKANLALSELNKEIQNQNAEIKSQRDHLDDLNHTKTKFFSIVSHDLRGPMAAFQSLSDIMDYNLKTKNYDELSEVTEEVVQRSKQVSLLLDNLLNWAVSEEGHFPYHPEAINVENAINEVKTIHQPLATYKGINLKTEVNTSHIVFADRNSYMTILRNLVSNAIKFTAQGGKILISTEQQDNSIIMKVSDTGVGMSEERYKKLFIHKEKDSTSGTSGEKGVGLGLQLVHDFVLLNKGKIDVKSEQGNGATFTVSLPAAQKILSEV